MLISAEDRNGNDEADTLAKAAANAGAASGVDAAVIRDCDKLVRTVAKWTGLRVSSVSKPGQRDTLLHKHRNASTELPRLLLWLSFQLSILILVLLEQDLSPWVVTCCANARMAGGARCAESRARLGMPSPPNIARGLQLLCGPASLLTTPVASLKPSPTEDGCQTIPYGVRCAGNTRLKQFAV